MSDHIQVNATHLISMTLKGDVKPPPAEWSMPLVNPEARHRAWAELTGQQRSDAKLRIARRAHRLICPYIPVGPPVRPPPPQWNIMLIDPVVRMERWSTLTSRQRNTVKSGIRNRLRTTRETAAAVASGTATAKQITYAANGGPRKWVDRQHATAAVAASMTEYRHRTSADTLAFRLTHSSGCIAEDCVFREGGPLCFLQHDHRDRNDKYDMVTSSRLTGNPTARLAEVKKTDCKCLWHHYLRTREQLRFRVEVASFDSHAERDLARLKAVTGCQHPHHHTMPYASMIPSLEVDPGRGSFFQVAHKLRGKPPQRLRGGVRARQHLADLMASKAWLFCAFCHATYTVCERSKMSQTPLLQFQYKQISEKFPQMVAFFDEQTHGFDWEAEKQRLHQRMSNAMKNRKRKREEEQDDHE